jgi:hypothetical protein
MFHSPHLILREDIITSVAYINARVGRGTKPTFSDDGGFRYSEAHPTLAFQRMVGFTSFYPPYACFLLVVGQNGGEHIEAN